MNKFLKEVVLILKTKIMLVSKRGSTYTSRIPSVSKNLLCGENLTPKSFYKNKIYSLQDSGEKKFFDCTDELVQDEINENIMEEQRTIIILPVCGDKFSLLNFYIIEAYENRLKNLFLIDQKKIFGKIRCSEVIPDSVNEISSFENLVAIGNNLGVIQLWQIDENELKEPLRFFNYIDSNFAPISQKEKKSSKILRKYSDYNSQINSLSWNKIEKNKILFCSDNGKINYLDLNKEKIYRLKNKDSKVASYLSYNPFNPFEYLIVFNDYYTLRDSRDKREASTVIQKKNSINVEWIFSDNYYLEIEKYGYLSIADKRYLSKNNTSIYINKLKTGLKTIENFSISKNLENLAITDDRGSILSWKITKDLKLTEKMILSNKANAIKKIAWCDSFPPQNNLLVLLDDFSVLLI